MSKIAQRYDDKAHDEGGTVTVDRTRLDPKYQKGLLALLYWLTYEEGGRALAHANRFDQGRTEQDIRQELSTEFRKFNVLGPAADALIEAHLAAVRWTEENKAKNFGKRQTQEELYMQHMAAVTWWLWEESAGDNFSLPW